MIIMFANGGFYKNRDIKITKGLKVILTIATLIALVTIIIVSNIIVTSAQSNASAQNRGLIVHIMPFKMHSGENMTQPMQITWPGSEKIIVTAIVFESNPAWFKIQGEIPFVLEAEAPNRAPIISVPLTVTVPQGYTGNGTVAEVRISAENNLGEKTSVNTPITVTVDKSPSPLLLPVGIGVAAAVAGVLIYKYKRLRY